MNHDQWQTKEQLVKLLCSLVEIPSITGTSAEVSVAEKIVHELHSLPYFQKQPEYLQLHPTGDGRKIVTALVKKNDDTKKTIVLVSHFDVVDVQDYGIWKKNAFDPIELTRILKEQQSNMPSDVQQDLAEGNWLFGRGTMDMKCGLTLHMSMVEQASRGVFDGNILLLAVCDEEVNSVGMRAAVPILLELAEKHSLIYKACLNSEPMFTRYPGDENKYIYTGSIGKVLPGFLCYGKETHVGEPLSGLNANFMSSQITCEWELNTEYCERVDEEVTPPPTNLIQKDLKEGYSVQIPHRAVTLYNLFLFEKSMDEVVGQLYQMAKKVARRIEEQYDQRAKRYSQLELSTPKTIHVNVFTVAELLDYAQREYGKAEVEHIFTRIDTNRGDKDDRDLTIQFVDELSILCKELAPMIVLFFAPPIYPAISSRNHPLIKKVTEEIMSYAWEQHQIRLKNQHYFGGISDLSYAGLQQGALSLQPLVTNMPLWEKGYSLPLKELEELNLPVLNLGPIGRDAHKWSERLDIEFAFEPLLEMLPVAIHKLLNEQ
ncbi:M20/M25/M40 family metallo-hydrolase [Brevibacillus sp. SYSU BS000544]|uniref:M20/M25/M40 family metallo-hydrolase n=1 Tax=Brevibacillus sp. SYSU BS000544 TaxID=3416443 RepID=UPI003CE523D9